MEFVCDELMDNTVTSIKHSVDSVAIPRTNSAPAELAEGFHELGFPSEVLDTIFTKRSDTFAGVCTGAEADAEAEWQKARNELAAVLFQRGVNMGKINIKRASSATGMDAASIMTRLWQTLCRTWQGLDVLFVGGVLNQFEQLDDISGGVRLEKLGEILMKLNARNASPKQFT